MLRFRAMMPLVLLWSALPVGPGPRAQDTLRDRLRDDRATDRWIYDDWEAARIAAVRNEKPIFAVFRCVP